MATVASFFIIRDANCQVPISGTHYDKLEPIQIAGLITGGILFILSFFNIANVLYDIKIVFFVVIVAILTVAGAMFWGAYIAFSEPCDGRKLFGLNVNAFKKNVFDSEDGHGIAVMVLDVIAGLMLCSIGFAFGKRL